MSSAALKASSSSGSRVSASALYSAGERPSGPGALLLSMHFKTSSISSMDSSAFRSAFPATLNLSLMCIKSSS